MFARRLADPFLLREKERLQAQLEDKQAQLDYLYMMSGIEPIDNEDEAEFQVKIRFDDKDERIMNGMNAIIDIIVDEKDDVYTVPSACIFKEDDNDYIYAAVKKDGKHVVTKIPVTKGTESDTNVEIDGDDLDDNMIVLNTPADYDEGKIINIKE